MTRQRKILFAGIVLLQILVVGAMVARKQAIILYGKEITLKTQAYDPTDIFRGHYAQLRFAIESIELSRAQLSPLPMGKMVYVILEKKNDEWDNVSASFAKPKEVKPEQVVLRGRASTSYDLVGYPILDLADSSEPGWLATQAEDAPWRINTQIWPRRRVSGNNLYWYDYQPKRKKGDIVYLHLVTYNAKQPVWTMHNINESPDPIKENFGPNMKEIILQGHIGEREERHFLQVDYGIENYFVSEGDAGNFQGGGVTVTVRVASSGEAVIAKVSPPKIQEIRPVIINN